MFVVIPWRATMIEELTPDHVMVNRMDCGAAFETFYRYGQGIYHRGPIVISPNRCSGLAILELKNGPRHELKIRRDRRAR